MVVSAWLPYCTSAVEPQPPLNCPQPRLIIDPESQSGGWRTPHTKRTKKLDSTPSIPITIRTSKPASWLFACRPSFNWSKITDLVLWVLCHGGVRWWCRNSNAIRLEQGEGERRRLELLLLSGPKAVPAGNQMPNCVSSSLVSTFHSLGPHDIWPSGADRHLHFLSRSIPQGLAGHSKVLIALKQDEHRPKGESSKKKSVHYSAFDDLLASSGRYLERPVGTPANSAYFGAPWMNAYLRLNGSRGKKTEKKRKIHGFILLGASFFIQWRLECLCWGANRATRKQKKEQNSQCHFGWNVALDGCSHGALSNRR